VTADIAWVLVLVQLPSEPSRHRVAVWRELRRAGAVPVSQGAWALPAGPLFQPALDRARDLTRRGDGTFAVIDAAPRDDEARRLIHDAYAEARRSEWAELLADCGKFEAEIDREIAREKFTFGELEEEEQSLDRLRRWCRELRRRDVLGLPEGRAAEQRLGVCQGRLEGYAELVYAAMRGAAPGIETPVEDRR